MGVPTIVHSSFLAFGAPDTLLAGIGHHVHVTFQRIPSSHANNCRTSDVPTQSATEQLRAMGNEPCKCLKSGAENDILIFQLPVCGGVDAVQAAVSSGIRQKSLEGKKALPASEVGRLQKCSNTNHYERKG